MVLAPWTFARPSERISIVERQPHVALTDAVVQGRVRLPRAWAETGELLLERRVAPQTMLAEEPEGVPRGTSSTRRGAPDGLEHVRFVRLQVIEGVRSSWSAIRLPSAFTRRSGDRLAFGATLG